MARFIRWVIPFVCVLVVLPAQATPRILVMGDSLSAAYGIDKSAGWVALLQDRLKAQSFPHEVVNLSISGETTAGGLRRLPAALEEFQPELVLLELGANDGLRAQSLDVMQANLQRMVTLSQEAGARVLLFEMRIPSNYGPRYTESFQQRFAVVAQATNVTLVPFFLMPIAADPEAFQDDGIHPNAKVQPLLLEAIWPQLEPSLSSAQLSSSR